MSPDRAGLARSLGPALPGSSRRSGAATGGAVSVVPMQYEIATHLGSGTTRYVLSDGMLEVHPEKSASRSIPLARIRRIHLKQDMPGMYSIEVRSDDGPPLRITSRHFLGLGRFEDRGPDYTAFARALIAATGRAQPAVELIAGSSLLFGIGWVLLVMVGILGVMLLAAFATGALAERGPPPLSGIITIPLGLVIGGGFVRQGRAATFVASDPPQKFLPA